MIKNRKEEKKVLILHNIRSVINVGAIFRTADAIGISKIYLTGYTPAPIDRFKRKRQDFAKAALGAEETVIWEQTKNPVSLVQRLKKDGFKIVALEQSSNSTDYKKVNYSSSMAILVGNEVLGVPSEILDVCDVVAEIPMCGQKESLNVSVATGIFLFRVLDKK